MYAKIFEQIYDSSIAENPRVRFVFMDLLVLADSDGVVDITHEAIARRTNVPIDWVREAISALEGPDPKSRTPDENGARIVRLDDHRDWGWIIVNYPTFRDIATDEKRRERTKIRTRAYRDRLKKKSPVTQCDASVTPPSPSPYSSVSSSGVGGVGEGGRVLINHPGLEDCLKHFTAHSDYTKDEVRVAFNSFQSDAVNGDWLTWRGTVVSDWRAAMEDKMAFSRGRANGKKKPGTWDLKAQFDAVEREIASHKANRDSQFYCGTPTAEQKEHLRNLRQRAIDLNSRIASGGA